MDDKQSLCRRFSCTQCGQCCYGWLPLTYADAMKFADRFPLAMVWTIHHPSSRVYALSKAIGAEIVVGARQKIAIQAVPTAYIPPTMPCPFLNDTLCGIHADKPLRCRAMPFYPYRDEADQADLLVQRKGWACDTGAQAASVYCNKKIVDRGDFDAERAALVQQQPMIKRYIDELFLIDPSIKSGVVQAAKMKIAGRIVTTFSPLLRFDATADKAGFARRQYPVLQSYATLVEPLSEHRSYALYYQKAAQDLEWFASRTATA